MGRKEAFFFAKSEKQMRTLHNSSELTIFLFLCSVFIHETRFLHSSSVRKLCLTRALLDLFPEILE